MEPQTDSLWKRITRGLVLTLSRNQAVLIDEKLLLITFWGARLRFVGSRDGLNIKRLTREEALAYIERQSQ